jgi:hypothetical protein
MTHPIDARLTNAGFEYDGESSSSFTMVYAQGTPGAADYRRFNVKPSEDWVFAQGRTILGRGKGLAELNTFLRSL